MKKYFLSLTVLMFFASTSIQAESNRAKIIFKGELKYNPCVVTTETVTVDFGTLTNSDFDSSGYTAWEMFNLKLDQCPAGLKSVSAKFTGTPSKDKPLFGYENAGTAKNISIQLANQGSEFGLGNGQFSTLDIKNGKADAALMARIKQETNKLFTAGSIDGVVQVEFTYQ
ncbi:fimbrial protein [Aeromonas salmonicida]|uniref:fimbrial protein n=1 Tax=Aeromonas salmonicida TaxID=645 RepID=UPI0027964276|nr:fimbrial protein [Aeromonas salmonicida]MDQ1884174.1 fimbrial protein [Aeromonas salmonicida]